jgi:putative membrane protein
VDYVTQHWSFDPFLVLATVTVAVQEVGLRRLARRSHPRRTRQRRLRSLLFYGGLAVLLVAVDSPIAYWSDRYFFVHMIQHILIMFFAPILIVAGAPWLPLLHAVPVAIRRRVGRAIVLGRRTAPLRTAWRFVSAPWTAVIAFDAAMVVWHLPGPFDLAVENQVVHSWCMNASFLVAGVLFWLQVIPSRPFHRRAPAVWQMGAIISTNVVMFVLAMALGIFTQHSWYSVYAHVPGVTLSPFADQQIGAAILWVCGDFWAIPALVVVVRRAIDQEGSLSEVLEGIVRARGTDRLATWAGPGTLDGGSPKMK